MNDDGGAKSLYASVDVSMGALLVVPGIIL